MGSKSTKFTYVSCTLYTHRLKLILYNIFSVAIFSLWPVTDVASYQDSKTFWFWSIWNSGFLKMVLGIELRALHLLGRLFIIWVTRQPFLCWLFWDRVLLSARQPNHDSPIYASHIAGMTGTWHLAFFFFFNWLKRGLKNFLPWLASNQDLPNLHLPSS
jgi:hypothetical protein